MFDAKRPTSDYLKHLNDLVTATFGKNEFKELTLEDIDTYVIAVVNQRIYQRTRQKKERALLAELKQKNPDLLK